MAFDTPANIIKILPYPFFFFPRAKKIRNYVLTIYLEISKLFTCKINARYFQILW